MTPARHGRRLSGARHSQGAAGPFAGRMAIGGALDRHWSVPTVKSPSVTTEHATVRVARATWHLASAGAARANPRAPGSGDAMPAGMPARARRPRSASAPSAIGIARLHRHGCQNMHASDHGGQSTYRLRPTNIWATCTSVAPGAAGPRRDATHGAALWWVTEDRRMQPARPAGALR